MKKSSLILTLFILGFIVLIYIMKLSARESEMRLKKVENEIQKSEQQLSLLQAEWARRSAAPQLRRWKNTHLVNYTTVTPTRLLTSLTDLPLRTEGKRLRVKFAHDRFTGIPAIPKTLDHIVKKVINAGQQ